MKVVIIDNDFRAYWRSKLNYLQLFLLSRNIQFHAIQLFLHNSSYGFHNKAWFTCLFPDKRPGNLKSKEIRNRLFAALDLLQPDIVIATPVVFYAGALALRWAKQNGKQFIMSEDTRPAQFKRNKIVQTIKNILIRQADGLWLPAKDYHEDYFRLHKRAFFIYGCDTIDNDYFSPSSNKNSYENFSILCVARLVPIKNLDRLLQAWQLVELRKTGYKLIITGSGPEEENLRRLQKSLQLTTVEFKGAIDNEDLPAYYHNSDAFILPSLSETWGLVVNEAMAAGLPVLLSRHVNAGRTLLEEGVNGYAFDPYQVNSIAAAILKYIHLNKEEKESMSRRSREIISSMSYENMSSQLLKALIALQQQKPRSPNLLAKLILNLWPGKYNTEVWDKIT